MGELVTSILVILAGCLVLVALFLILRKVAVGAVLVATIAYDLASDYGVAGRALYLGCWILLFPIMMPICVCFGMLIMLGRGNFERPLWDSRPEPAGISGRRSQRSTSV